ncbi:MAG: hypothetical protein ABIT01_03995 [Thermoanaerobaculia bacterium]
MAEPVVHTRVPFEFFVELPFAEAAPLFGAWAEKAWEPGWEPRFLFPDPPADVEGSVFTVSHGDSEKAVWVNTVFDLVAGHVQYVYFLSAIVTRIDLRLTSAGAERTGVAVVYERTALDPSANAAVTELANGDRGKAPAWRETIDASVRMRKGPAAG